MWTQILDWAAVAVPIVLGLVAWVIPIRRPTRGHRWTLFAGGVALSGLIFLQQCTTRQEHAREIDRLATKQDIPTAGDIVKEIVKVLPPERRAGRWALNDEQITKLAQRMAPYATNSPKNHDLIQATMGNPDSAAFAWSLVAAFRAAHWNGVGGSGFGQSIFNQPVEGVHVVIHAVGDHVPGLQEFIATMREAGIEPIGEIAQTVPEGEFQIIVGDRPR